MGLIRKTVKVGTFGLAPIHYHDQEERQTKAAERQLKVQRQMLEQQQHAAARGPSVVAAADPVEQLARLAELRDRGVLTADEFEKQKARLLR